MVLARPRPHAPSWRPVVKKRSKSSKGRSGHPRIRSQCFLSSWLVVDGFTGRDRGGAATTVTDRSALLIGCRAVGGHLATALARRRGGRGRARSEWKKFASVPASVTHAGIPPDPPTSWRQRSQSLLVLLGAIAALSFSTWRALLNNFAVDRVAFTGAEIGTLQSLREVPGLLAFTAVFYVGAGVAVVSLGLSQLIPRRPKPGHETLLDRERVALP
jgi:hypothetical protein